MGLSPVEVPIQGNEYNYQYELFQNNRTSCWCGWGCNRFWHYKKNFTDCSDKGAGEAGFRGGKSW